jgi:hypothetical protein
LKLTNVNGNKKWMLVLLAIFAISGCSKSKHDGNSVGVDNNKRAEIGENAIQNKLILSKSGNYKSELHPDSSKTERMDGLMFVCGAEQIDQIQLEMETYFRELGIKNGLIKKTEPEIGKIIYTLTTPEFETDTLSLKKQKKYHINDEVVILPANDGKTKVVKTVSKKEILLSLLQHGRLTVFKGNACSINALREHIGVRQNIVAWVEKLNWQWPDGGSAFWNKKYWDKGTPLASVIVDDALLDAFIHEKQYGLGCFTATKLSYAHGVLDYYARVKNDAVKAALVRKRLLLDQDPLVGIAPSEMWSFEKYFDTNELPVPGKILSIKRAVAANNFVPGDWIYLLNTDAMTYEKSGYEGSNAVYLGRGIFDDYFNDHNHHYTFKEKIDEVYQWRNGVFSRSRDFKMIKPLSLDDFNSLSKTPPNGGLLEDFRVAPYYFGYEDLPKIIMH